MSRACCIAGDDVLDFAIRTRPLAKRREAISLRVAVPGDGETIARLIQDDWRIEGVDWSQVGANWLVMDGEDDVVGCLEVLPGKPFGRLEHLAVSVSIVGSKRARIVRKLIDQGMAVLRVHGSQAVSVLIPHTMASYAKVLLRRGAVSIGDGQILMRRL